MDETVSQRSRDWRRSALLVVGTILLAVYLLRLDWATVRLARQAFPVGIAISVVLLNLITGALKYGRWSQLLARRGIDTRGTAFEEYLAINAGFFIGLVTPGTSGELTRGAFSKVPNVRAVSIVGYEKTSDLAVLILMVAGSAVVQFTSGISSWIASGLILLATGLSYTMFVKYDWLVTAPVRWLLHRFGSDRQVASMRGVYWEFYDLLRDRRAILTSAVYSVLLWTLPVVQMHLIIIGLGGDIPFKTSAFTFLFPYLIGVLSLIPAGIGAFDIATDQFGSQAISMAGAAGELGSIVPLYFRLLVTVPLIALGYMSQVILSASWRSGANT